MNELYFWISLSRLSCRVFLPNEADGVASLPFFLQWDLPHHEAWVVHDSDL